MDASLTLKLKKRSFFAPFPPAGIRSRTLARKHVNTRIGHRRCTIAFFLCTNLVSASTDFLTSIEVCVRQSLIDDTIISRCQSFGKREHFFFLSRMYRKFILNTNREVIKIIFFTRWAEKSMFKLNSNIPIDTFSTVFAMMTLIISESNQRRGKLSLKYSGGRGKLLN